MRIVNRGSWLLAALATAAVAHLAGASLAQADGYQTRGKVAFERPLDWSGLYFGIHSGWAWSQTDAFFPGGNPAAQIVGVAGQGFSVSHDAPIVGGQIGLQHQFGHLVVGVEGSLSTTYRNDPGNDLCPKQSIALFDCNARLNDILTVGGRLGWSMGHWMPYATGGYASARFADTATNRSLAPVGFTIVEWANERAQGWYIGGGVDWVVSPGWTIGIDYRHYDFGSYLGLGSGIVGGLPGGALPNDNATFNATADTLTVRVSWKLGRSEPAPLK